MTIDPDRREPDDFPEAPLDGDPTAYAREVLAWSRARAGGDHQHWTVRGVRRMPASGARAPQRRGRDYLVPTPFMWLAVSFVVMAISALGTGWAFAAQRADRAASGEAFTAVGDELAEAREELAVLRDWQERMTKRIVEWDEMGTAITADLNRAIATGEPLEAIMAASILARYEEFGVLKDEEVLAFIRRSVREVIDSLGGPMSTEEYEKRFGLPGGGDEPEGDAP